MFNLADFTFVNPFIKDSSLSESSVSQRQREAFIKNLLQNNYLVIRQFNGEMFRVEALSYDKKRNQIIISDRAEKGLIYLDKGDKVEVYTSLDQEHEYFSFISKVVKVKIKGVRFYYYLNVPAKLQKSTRRIIDRHPVKQHSTIRINHSAHSGQVIDLSKDGIGIALNGYYPLPVDVGYNLEKCHVEILQSNLRKSLSFDCSINVRRISYVKEPERLTIIGGVLTNLAIQSEHQLQHYLEN